MNHQQSEDIDTQLEEIRIKDIKFEFDERNLTRLRPVGSVSGLVQIRLTDDRVISDYCTRDTLGETIKNLLNKVLAELSKEEDNDAIYQLKGKGRVSKQEFDDAHKPKLRPCRDVHFYNPAEHGGHK